MDRKMMIFSRFGEVAIVVERGAKKREYTNVTFASEQRISRLSHDSANYQVSIQLSLGHLGAFIRPLN